MELVDVRMNSEQSQQSKTSCPRNQPQELKELVDKFIEQYTEVTMNDRTGSLIPDLLTLEDWTAELTQQLGQQMVDTFTHIRLQQATENRETCLCNKPVKIHRKTSWIRHTLHGPVTVEDVYAYCKKCHKSIRPLHSWLGTNRETWSLRVQKIAVDFASDESCQKAVEKLKRVYPGVIMNRSSALCMLHQHGVRAKEFIGKKLAEVLARTAYQCSDGGIAELEVEYDGGMIPVATLEPIKLEDGQEPELTPIRKIPKRRRKCRWEEAKVGLTQVPGKESRLYSVRPTAELDEAFMDLLALACISGYTSKTQVRGVADGARYIRTRMEKTFNDSSFHFILDRPHAKEHLSDAGKAMEVISNIPAQQWASEALHKLEAGKTHEVVEELRAAFEKADDDTLRIEANYFEHNQDAVAYKEYRQNGWSTASSEVESAHRHVVQTRLKIPGAWWHPDKVSNILSLRMLKANDWWEEYWNSERQMWAKRAETYTANRSI